MLVIAGCKRALHRQFEPCVISGRGAARPDPCEGRGKMHRALVLAAHCKVCWVLLRAARSSHSHAALLAPGWCFVLRSCKSQFSNPADGWC